MSRGYDEEAMMPMPRLGLPPPWWRKWMIRAVFVVSVAVVPLVAWVLR
jgi:hypothetical protein